MMVLSWPGPKPTATLPSMTKVGTEPRGLICVKARLPASLRAMSISVKR